MVIQVVINTGSHYRRTPEDKEMRPERSTIERLVCCHAANDGLFLVSSNALGRLPVAKLELSVAHVDELPALSLDVVLRVCVLFGTAGARDEDGRGPVVVRAVSISEKRMAHQSHYRSTKCRPLC